MGVAEKCMCWVELLTNEWHRILVFVVSVTYFHAILHHSERSYTTRIHQPRKLDLQRLARVSHIPHLAYVSAESEEILFSLYDRR